MEGKMVSLKNKNHEHQILQFSVLNAFLMQHPSCISFAIHMYLSEFSLLS